MIPQKVQTVHTALLNQIDRSTKKPKIHFYIVGSVSATKTAVVLWQLLVYLDLQQYSTVFT